MAAPTGTARARATASEIALKPLHVPTAVGAFLAAAIFTGVRTVDFDAVLAEATRELPSHEAHYAKIVGPRVAKWVVPFLLGLLAYAACSLVQKLLVRLVPSGKAA